MNYYLSIHYHNLYHELQLLLWPIYGRIRHMNRNDIEEWFDTIHTSPVES